MAIKEMDSKAIQKKLDKAKAEYKNQREKINQLAARLTTARRRENAKRHQAIGEAIEEALGVDALSQEELDHLLNWFTRPRQKANGETYSPAGWLGAEITKMREAVQQPAATEETKAE